MPAVTVDPVPVVVELVVEFTTVPVALPVRICVVNWSVAASRAPPSALVTCRVGREVLVKVQTTPWPRAPVGVGRVTVNESVVTGTVVMGAFPLAVSMQA